MDLNTALEQHRNVIHSVATRLDAIAFHLAAVGMDRLADDLNALADALPPSVKSVSDSYHDDLTNQVRHGEAMMGNLLKATLVGAIRPVNPRD